MCVHRCAFCAIARVETIHKDSTGMALGHLDEPRYRENSATVMALRLWTLKDAAVSDAVPTSRACGFAYPDKSWHQIERPEPERIP